MTTRLSDVVVPSRFAGYQRQVPVLNNAFVNFGIMVRSPFLDLFLAGPSYTINVPFYKPLANDEENHGNDNPASEITPKKIGTGTEIAVRLERNQGWQTADFASLLATGDEGAVASAIEDYVADYWSGRLNAASLSVVRGVLNGDAKDHSGSLTTDIAGATAAADREFNADVFIDAVGTFSDFQNRPGIRGALVVHPRVYAGMKKKDLLDTIRPSEAGDFPTYMGWLIVLDATLPTGANVVRKSNAAGTANMYESYLISPGALQLGVGSGSNDATVTRDELKGGGSGIETLVSRVHWCIHPTGCRYVPSITSGSTPANGPATTAGTLIHPDSFDVEYTDTKIVGFRKIVTQEPAV